MSKQIHVSMKKLVAFTVCIIVLTASIGVYFGRAVTTSPTSIWIGSGLFPSGSSTYTVWVESGVNYVKNAYGETVNSGTNLSSILQPLIAQGTNFQFKVGHYDLDTLVLLNISGLRFTGENWYTYLHIGVNGGFNITSTSLLSDISFENFYWLDSGGGIGAGLSNYGITSAMEADDRIAHFTFRNNRVQYFSKDGTIFLNLTNLEVSTIEYNYFYQVTTAFIQLCSNNYNSGNNWIRNNVFYAGTVALNENGIRLTALKNDGDGMIAWVHIENNQIFGGTAAYRTTLLFVNLTTVEGTIKGIDVSSNRIEYGRIIETTCANSTWTIKNLDVHDNRITTTDNSVKFLSWDGNTQNSQFHNNYLQDDGSSGIWFEDNCTSSSQYNLCLDNQFVGNAQTFSPSQSTWVKGNFGLGASYTIKTSGVDNIHNAADNAVCNWGASAGALVNTTAYTVRNNDVYLNVTGGTVMSIQIISPSGTTISTVGTSCSWVCVPVSYAFNVTWTVAPTIALMWQP